MMIFVAAYPRHCNAALDDRMWLEIERVVLEREAIRAENEELRARIKAEPDAR